LADGSFGQGIIRHAGPPPAGPFPLYQDADEEGDVVLFAGAGGVDQAVEEWFGPGHAAVNHWPLAISVNKRNFPQSEHWCADVWDTDPALPLAGKRIRLLWLSPDCRHFSTAKGKAPVSDSIRALAWIAIPWIVKRRPRVIMIENVPPFVTWGPTMLNEKGECVPNPKLKGRTFKRFVRRFEKRGYTVEFRLKVDASDYGEATRRVRFIMIARCDGLPIVWPEETHAPPEVAIARGKRPHRAAAEIIDFTRPCHSIFLTPEEVKAQGLRIKRPLQEATMRRIALGLFKHVINCAEPFIVELTHQGGNRVHGVGGRLPTITGANRGELALCSPVVTVFRGDCDGRSMKEPLPAITANSFIKRPGAAAPLGLTVAHLSRQFGASIGSDCREPVGSIMAGGGGKTALVAAHLSQLRSSNNGGGGDLVDALPAMTAQGGHLALVESMLECDLEMTRPFSREGEVRAFLTEYYGKSTIQDLTDPLTTATSKDRLGLVLVHGVAYRIVDIGMRMLDPETELAAAMGVRKGFVLGFDAYGNRVSKTAITKLVGNMVCRRLALALIAANFPKVAVAEAVAA
jgi:DNA (cytosine-5)-methyltransferase 1